MHGVLCTCCTSKSISAELTTVTQGDTACLLLQNWDRGIHTY